MSLDDAAYAELWNIWRSTGIRPEWLLPVLANESGLNPGVANGAGAPYYGIGQNSGEFIAARTGMSPGEYMAQPASFQLREVVGPYFKSQIESIGVTPQSGVQVYQYEYCPASLGWAPGLDDVITSPTEHTACAYEANAGFDRDGKGYITPRDLANTVAAQAAKPSVQQAISNAYAVAPWGAGGMTDPVFGTAGSGSSKTLLWGVVAVLAAGGATYLYATTYGVPRWVPRLPRGVRRVIAG